MQENGRQSEKICYTVSRQSAKAQASGPEAGEIERRRIPMSCWLETKSWPEAEEAIKASGGVAIVPIGSVEQHSLHLPVGTDTYVAITLAEDAGEQTGAVVTPPVWFRGVTTNFFGSFSLGLTPESEFCLSARRVFCISSP